MPLDYSKSASSFGNNIKKEMNSGKPKNQAVAIAYSVQGERKPKVKRFGKMEDYLGKKKK